MIFPLISPFDSCFRLLLPLLLLIAIPTLDGETPGRLTMQRGLLDAPRSKAVANITAVASAASAAAHVGITLNEHDRLDGTHDRTSRITTEIAAGAHLVVDDVTVVTPTGT